MKFLIATLLLLTGCRSGEQTSIGPNVRGGRAAATLLTSGVPSNSSAIAEALSQSVIFVPPVSAGAALLLQWRAVPLADHYTVYYTDAGAYDHPLTVSTNEAVVTGLPLATALYFALTVTDEFGVESDPATAMFVTPSQSRVARFYFYDPPMAAHAEQSNDLQQWTECVNCRPLQTNADNSRDWFVAPGASEQIFFRLAGGAP